LWLALVCPSLFVVQKYAGWSGTVGYAVVAGAAVALRAGIPIPRSRHAVRALAAVTLAGLVAMFLTVYPTVNVQTPGSGSDDDDTYNIGARAILDGRSPYAERTYLGNALHPLPGSFLLAIPFVLLGTSAWQNLFWLTLFCAAVRVETEDDGRAVRLAWLILAFSPTVIHQIVTGTGHGANTIYVLLGLWWLIRTRHRDIAAIAWGVTLASRANFIFLLPLAFGWVRQQHGLRTAVRVIALTCLTITLLSLPFYLYDPGNFGPLEGANRLLRFNALFPLSGELIMALTAAVAVGLSTRRMDAPALFMYCAIVEATPVLLGAALSSLHRRQPDLAYAGYGTFAAWFVFMAAASLDRTRR
jgi:hypothetical protein